MKSSPQQEYEEVIKLFKELKEKIAKEQFIQQLKKEGCKEEIIKVLYE